LFPPVKRSALRILQHDVGGRHSVFLEACVQCSSVVMWQAGRFLLYGRCWATKGADAALFVLRTG